MNFKAKSSFRMVFLQIWSDIICHESKILILITEENAKDYLITTNLPQ
jgi:hypothetical protein